MPGQNLLRVLIRLVIGFSAADCPSRLRCSNRALQPGVHPEFTDLDAPTGRFDFLS
jgi:hypothetical protein